MLSATQYQIRPEAREEVSDLHGEILALSVFILFDVKNVFAPLTLDREGNLTPDASQAIHLWDDQIEAL